jgi:hypothetical protein
MQSGAPGLVLVVLAWAVALLLELAQAPELSEPEHVRARSLAGALACGDGAGDARRHDPLPPVRTTPARGMHSAL